MSSAPPRVPRTPANRTSGFAARIKAESGGTNSSGSSHSTVSSGNSVRITGAKALTSPTTRQGRPVPGSRQIEVATDIVPALQAGADPVQLEILARPVQATPGDPIEWHYSYNGTGAADAAECPAPPIDVDFMGNFHPNNLTHGAQRWNTTFATPSRAPGAANVAAMNPTIRRNKMLTEWHARHVPQGQPPFYDTV